MVAIQVTGWTFACYRTILEARHYVIKTDLGIAEEPSGRMVGAINQVRKLKMDASTDTFVEDLLLVSLQHLNASFGGSRERVGFTPTIAFAKYKK